MYHFLVVITLLYKKLFFIQVFNKPFNSSRLRTIWLQLCIVAAFLFTSPYFPVFAEDTKQVEVFAYHGVLEDVPENTFAALRRVAELGIDGIAVDIRQTKDNQLVLMCDETIDRTTDGKGFVDQLLYAEIQQYDAGSWRGSEFRKERVPLLSDALKFCKINDLKMILNVKQTCLGSQVLNLIRESGMSSKVYLWGMLRNLPMGDTEFETKELMFLPMEEMTKEKIDRIHEEKKYAFSIILGNDSRKTIKDRIKMGVDVVMVDYPCVAMDVLNYKGQAIVDKKPKSQEKNIPRQEDKNNAAYIQEQVKTLIKTIKDADYDKARTAAIALMVLPQRYTTPSLVKLLKDSNPQIKQHAAWALGFCGDISVSMSIESLLKDKNTAVRREAVLALKRLNASQLVPALLEVLKNETDLGVKYDIARTLGTLGDQGAVYPIIKLLAKERSWYVKGGCIEALGNIGSDQAMNTLAKILITDAGEDAAWTRTKAAWGLAAIGQKSVPLLIKALDDKEEETRRRAGWALIKIGHPAVMALVSSLHEIKKETRERAAQCLGWIGDESAVAALVWALRDKESSVVSSAAWALGRIGSPKALTALQWLVNNDTIDVRENAAEAIERIMLNKEKMAYQQEHPQRP
ncbi:MAG: HEAT repeat domain-containing protein [Candidatus Brocadiaceae bacterium]|nr:HEAT repeat domain-containing protein [Candidatus Brocadiaceae bacterium]